MTSRAVLRRELMHVPDVLASYNAPNIERRAQERGYRAIVCAPMLRKDGAIGTIVLTKPVPGPFLEKQIALLRTFADR